MSLETNPLSASPPLGCPSRVRARRWPSGRSPAWRRPLLVALALGQAAAALIACDAERVRALEQLRDREASARVQALRVLAARPDPALAPKILPLLVDPVGRVRHAALVALGVVGTRGHLDAVIARLRDRDLEVRLVALRLLGDSGRARAVPTLLPLLGDASAIVRNAAAQALQALGRSPLQQRQAEAAARFDAELLRLADPAPQVRAEAARELGRSGAARAAGPLLRRLAVAGESTLVIAAVLRALVRVDAAAARRTLRELGTAADPGRRLVAARVLAALRPPAWALLRAALSDPQPEVRGAALRGISRLRAAPAAALDPPAALATVLCAALELEGAGALRLLAAEAAGGHRLGCAPQAQAAAARARQALGVVEPSAGLTRALLEAFDLLARLRRQEDGELLIALLQRAMTVLQWEAEPWIGAERWREGASAAAPWSAPRATAIPSARASAKASGEALHTLLSRFHLRAADGQEQPLMPPTSSAEAVASRFAWLPRTVETEAWLARVARDAEDAVLAAAALDRLAEGALPASGARRAAFVVGAGADGRGGGARPEASSPLQQAVEVGLGSIDRQRRRAATGACVQLPPPQGEARALGLLGDADGAVREAAALVLGRLRAHQALPALLVLLARDPSPALVHALALLRDRRATRPLLRLLEEDHPAPRLGERRVVVEALGALADQAAAPALERELGHPDWRLRRAAASALARAGRARSRELLGDCAADYYGAVRQACAEALAKLAAAR
ncbi:MAG: HEAT repeat domain-containing protein [Proteobacteria bacterium]|nr:HEAT repeat domain-containing protein [Pseudomonadota bacterium]